MTDLAIEIPTNEEAGYYIYFFHTTEGRIIYIGKTISLRKRMHQHFSKDLLEFEPWRMTVDKSNILTFKCSSLTDLELYETYFINKYKPVYNKDKVYNDSCTFELPLLESIKYKFNLKFIRGEGLFAEICKTLLEDNTSYESHPLINRAVEILGDKKLKALKYRKNNIDKELLVVSQLKNLKEVGSLLDINIGDAIPKEYLKSKIQGMYDHLNIKKLAKATDINTWYSTENTSKRINGKVVAAIKIISQLEQK